MVRGIDSNEKLAKASEEASSLHVVCRDGGSGDTDIWTRDTKIQLRASLAGDASRRRRLRLKCRRPAQAEGRLPGGHKHHMIEIQTVPFKCVCLL
jgi:hypothetical protein